MSNDGSGAGLVVNSQGQLFGLRWTGSAEDLLRIDPATAVGNLLGSVGDLASWSVAWKQPERLRACVTMQKRMQLSIAIVAACSGMRLQYGLSAHAAHARLESRHAGPRVLLDDAARKP